MIFSQRHWAENLLASADVKIDGNRPWDIHIYNDKFFERVAHKGTLGLGESYMDGWWDASAVDQFINKAMAAHLESKLRFSWVALATYLKGFFLNLQTENKAFEVGQKHYDIGNDLYKVMLDKRMTYTCGYWQSATTLDEAQEAKLDLVCRKIGLKAGDRVLDIGCGWGSFAKFAAEKYGASIVGITISHEQLELGQQLCAGLPIELRLQDYRQINEKFDHIVSLGMFEHVGSKNYQKYMQVVARCLKDDGLFLLHTIGSNCSLYASDPWITRYIFPNSMLPSIAQIAHASAGKFVMEDWHNFGADYDKTLMAWWHNFDKAWPELKGRYSERFYRMWKYYLLSCAGMFRTRDVQLWQIVFSKKGVAGGYQHVR